MAESLATEQTKPNQSFLSSFSFGDDTLETMIEVDQVSMIFNMAAEQLNIIPFNFKFSFTGSSVIPPFNPFGSTSCMEIPFPSSSNAPSH